MAKEQVTPPRPTEESVETCYNLSASDIPEAELEYAHELFVDFLGMLLGSADSTESSRIAREYTRAVFGSGPASVCGEGDGFPAPAAAFANGTIAHGIELDDTHSGASLHPGAVVFPAAMAVAEQEDADGETFLSAVIGGYELTARVGRAANPTVLYDRGFHPTSCCGVFGAALAAARVKGLPIEETINAVGLAGSFAAGNLEYFADGTMSKRFQPGIAAQAGVTAAELASRGFTGPRTIFEGENGFLAGYGDGGDFEALVADFDDEWTTELARTGIKPHACCRYNQTPIDAALAVVEEHDLDVGALEQIEFDLVGPAIEMVVEPRDHKVQPRTTTDAQFSLYYSVAVALMEGQAFLEQFREPYLSDPDVLELASRVEASHDPALDELYPDYWPAVATISTEDGRTFSKRLETCRGDPANPLSHDELEEKFRKLASRQLDDEGITALEDAARTVVSAADVSSVSRHLRR